jgi:hypothetical protein
VLTQASCTNIIFNLKFNNLQFFFTMFKQLLLLAAATPFLCNPMPLLEDRQTSSCATGVHIIVARASGEQQGEGIIGQVATDVVNQIPGSDSVAVDYPATLENYESSESQGVTAMANLIEQYTSSCPNSKIVLMGYSQVCKNVRFKTLPLIEVCRARKSLPIP